MSKSYPAAPTAEECRRTARTLRELAAQADTLADKWLELADEADDAGRP